MRGSLSATNRAMLPFTDQKVTFIAHIFKKALLILRLFICAYRIKSNLFEYVSGVNIGGVGTYLYDVTANEAPAAVPVVTKAGEEKKVASRGPVKGEKYVE